MPQVDPEDQSTIPLLARSVEELASVPVFPLIQSITRDVIESVDSALTWEQMNAPEINFTLVRPTEDKYTHLDNIAVVHGFLLTRQHFLNCAHGEVAFRSLRLSRAIFCELLAMKMARYFASKSQLDLLTCLTTSWNPLQGAPPSVVQEIKRASGEHDPELSMSALEVAVATESKKFLSYLLIQNVVQDIYTGHVVFSCAADRGLLADNYKQRAVDYYDARKSPFLDHYRLRVPKYRNILEVLDFTILLALFCISLSERALGHFVTSEILFIVFAFGFILDEIAACQEHGWLVYAMDMWNSFDMAFIVIFASYFGLRLRGIIYNEYWASDLAFDVLACGACVLFPRLAFFSISNNVVVLALSGMIKDYLYFIFAAMICASGLLFTLWEFASAEQWPLKNIAWMLVQIGFFGNSTLSFTQAKSFHPLFGPILLVTYAALSNTLLITMLISILSNTFAKINQHAPEEFLFQFAISTLEGVKSDAIFSYQPPFNLLAVFVLWPLSFVLSPRALHTVNVFMIRVTSIHVLLIIGIYERFFAKGNKLFQSGKGAAQAVFSHLPLKNVAFIEAFTGSQTRDLYEAIFEAACDPDLPKASEEEEEDSSHQNGIGNGSGNGNEAQGQAQEVERRETPRAGRSPDIRGRMANLPSLPGSPRAAQGRPRSRSRLAPSVEMRPPSPSPLARLYGGIRLGMPMLSPSRANFGNVGTEDDVFGTGSAEGAIGRLEGLLKSAKDLPVVKLKEEMKELQDRQARIEALLVSLTRSLRGEST
ncbi:hypothetical protein BOTBODRAFT_37715 [Botryobasidium botryosum FD-172 SS1]|uniref:Ion transport domain-containing protein n=1 Tax=Botryobasidium botryosum (strain FD-172 SS1) TaxID=930990 RepID=A0A067LZK2_BOTB1|nr:hypothetical protein BOTBODRAFT_37715 [Botryobasidium botryosum FD-172 SS1]